MDEETLARFLQESAPALRAYLEPRIPDRLRPLISAEDLIQEVWIDAFRTLPSRTLANDDALDRWLTTLARRKLFNAVRAIQRLKRQGNRGRIPANPGAASSISDVFSVIPSANRTPSSLVGVLEAGRSIATAMTDLPSDAREAIRLRFCAGHSVQDITKIMKRTSSSVRALIFRGLRQLRHQLGSAAGYLSGSSTIKAFAAHRGCGTTEKRS